MAEEQKDREKASKDAMQNINQQIRDRSSLRIFDVHRRLIDGCSCISKKLRRALEEVLNLLGAWEMLLQ